jgi:hypothetical protein
MVRSAYAEKAASKPAPYTQAGSSTRSAESAKYQSPGCRMRSSRNPGLRINYRWSPTRAAQRFCFALAALYVSPAQPRAYALGFAIPRLQRWYALYDSSVRGRSSRRKGFSLRFQLRLTRRIQSMQLSAVQSCVFQTSSPIKLQGKAASPGRLSSTPSDYYGNRMMLVPCRSAISRRSSLQVNSSN